MDTQPVSAPREGSTRASSGSSTGGGGGSRPVLSDSSALTAYAPPGLGRSGGPPALPRARRLLPPPAPQGNSHLPIPRDLAGGHAGSTRTRGRGRHGARPRAEVATSAPSAPPALPGRAPTSSARAHAPSSLPRSPAGCGRCPGPSYLLARTPGGVCRAGDVCGAGDVCRVAPRAGSLPAPLRPGPALSVPPTAAPAAPPRRPRRSPGPAEHQGLPATPPAAKHTGLPRTLAFPVYLKGVTGPGGGGFPSPHLPAADARAIIAHLNKAAAQVRAVAASPPRQGPAGAAPHAPAWGGQGKGEGKANKAWSRGWSRACCGTGATDVPQALLP